MPIHILSDAVASQIAAGEVVERPASVVKELLENALDARAHQVVIRVEKAGRSLIETADDGAGIPSDELALSVAHHATSKLKTASDLFHITSLGFRGEALASIASISRLTITSRVQEEASGSRLTVEGGRIGIVEPVGAPIGTVVRVEELFYNVPARLKFLKQDVTERMQIDTLVTRYALAYPEIRIHVYQDNKPVLQTSGNGNCRELLAGLYGVDIGRQMLEVSLEETDFKLKGFISPVALTRSNRREITFFVNGRWIQEIALTSALVQAYHTLLMVGRYPLAVIFLEIPPEEIDVNVHPAKSEVRFRQPDRVFSTVQRAVKRALLAFSPIPHVSPPTFWQAQIGGRVIDPAWEMSEGIKSPKEGLIDTEESTTKTASGGVSQVELPSGHLPLLRLVGQVGAAYLVAEGPDGLYLIDQHAAHERVLFERFRKQQAGKIASQELLVPMMLNLPPRSAQLLQEQLSVLQLLGFGVEAFGSDSFLIRAVPAILTGSDPLTAVRAVVEDFEEDETPLQAELEARLIARICKRAAVKAGKTLSTEEQRILLQDLEACQSPRTCPHGRPTMIHLSVDLLERQFGRRGAR